MLLLIAPVACCQLHLGASLLCLQQSPTAAASVESAVAEGELFQDQQVQLQLTSLIICSKVLFRATSSVHMCWCVIVVVAAVESAAVNKRLSQDKPLRSLLMIQIVGYQFLALAKFDVWY